MELGDKDVAELIRQTKMTNNFLKLILDKLQGDKK